MFTFVDDVCILVITQRKHTYASENDTVNYILYGHLVIGYMYKATAGGDS